MSAAATMGHGLDDEILAAFVDGRLNESERAAVIEHLASCGECRSKANDASDIAEMLAAAAGEANVVDFSARKRRWPLIAAAIAAAAVIAVVLLGPMRDSIFDEPGIPMLVKASSQLETRRTYGRLSGGFPYKEMMRVTRGAGDGPEDGVDVSDLPLLEAQGKIQNATRPDPHARGVGLLLLGQQAQAVEALEALLATNPPNRDAVAQDLAVALLQRGETERSLQLSNELWAKARTPEIAWNRAYALQHLGRNEEAIAAWDEYLKLDPSSPWSQEAVRRRDEARQDLQLEREIPAGRP
jgi:tetratricopeptide (TPR) repeat protein